MIASALTVIGVRHHSPACARLVRREIARLQPKYVLIEGPADFNPYLADLRRPHRLPVAIFSFYADEQRAHASYAPFCDSSPEWQALQAAWENGAEPLFCDLPSWHPDFGDRDNRYADPHRLLERYAAASAALAAALGAEGPDALWDALAEQADDATLPAVLGRYFSLLRPPGQADPREAGRERFMAEHAAWALRAAEGRPVLLVCGGWHVGGIQAALAVLAAAAAPDGERPALPAPPDAGVRSGSYVVPYSYQRLDRFTGYAAGMPSPGYYDAVFATGLEQAADWAMARIADALRQAGQVVSTADRIAWQAQALALARLRGHRAVLRADLLDAALSTIVKEALEVPPAWAEPGVVTRGNDALVVAMLRALSGEREGQIASGTRHPPLLQDVEARLRAQDLEPGPATRRVRIDWQDPAARPRAHVLHQLCLLGIAGVTRLAGPQRADARDLVEQFEILSHRHWLAALIEASIWGGTLPMAASARLAARIEASADDVDALASALSAALFAGLLTLGHELVARLRAGIAACHDIAALGRAGRLVYRVFRFGDVFGAAAQAACGAVAEALFARALWLLDGVQSDQEGAGAVDAVLACRDFALKGTGLTLDRQAARALFLRRAADDATPPALAGAALGYLVACGDTEAEAPAVVARLRRFGLPDRLGDFLLGLFALAREALADADTVLQAVDGLVAAWSDQAFLRAMPAMRLAFAWFPPREREALARRILQRYGYGMIGAEAEALAWMRQRNPVADQAAALAREAKVAAWLARYGL